MLGIGRKIGTEEVWQDIIKEVDVNGDGEVSFEEFKTMMKMFLGGSLETKIQKSKGITHSADQGGMEK